ncbi:hypothetical protein DL95DRAFT_415826 [Leptodontidium sp. 2 PMI_412]|nr:hypothetical protein DL95DRAFT_415826 [Leptodontidium sp. 2 PMI_412]
MPKQILPPTSGRAATSESGEEEMVPKGYLEQCELEKEELEGELDDINERLAHTLVSNRFLIGSLVRNYEYNIQCSVGTIDKLSERLASLVLSSESPAHCTSVVIIYRLGTAVTSVIKSGTDEEIRLLLQYLTEVITTVQPRGFLMAGLFFIVASLSKQCVQICHGLWFKLYVQTGIIVGSPRAAYKRLICTPQLK